MRYGSLYDVLHNRSHKYYNPDKFTLPLILKIAKDTTRGMIYLHEYKVNGVKTPIIHRQVHPLFIRLTFLMQRFEEWKYFDIFFVFRRGYKCQTYRFWSFKTRVKSSHTETGVDIEVFQFFMSNVQ